MFHLQDRPGAPSNITESETFMEYTMDITISWISHNTTITVRIDPPLNSIGVFTTRNKSLQLTVSYNTNYTLTLMATNCAGNSSVV